MTLRPTPRLLLFVSVALFLILLVSFFRPESPLSPEVRAPGHLPQVDSNGKPRVAVGGGDVISSEEILKGGVVMPHLGNETIKAELGRSSWRLLHTMMARYPDEPSDEQQEALRSFVYLFGRLYPCGECASHFQSQLTKFPPQVSSRSSAAGWACHIHNEVNKMLEKEIFDCSKIGDFYDCGCGDDDPGDGPNTTENKKGVDGHEPPSDQKINKLSENERQVDKELFKPTRVVINDEPPTNG